MSGLKKGAQQGTGRSGGMVPPNTGDSAEDRGAEFGTSERATRGTNRDADESGTSVNEGHGHPRGERGTRSGS